MNNIMGTMYKKNPSLIKDTSRQKPITIKFESSPIFTQVIMSLFAIQYPKSLCILIVFKTSFENYLQISL